MLASLISILLYAMTGQSFSASYSPASPPDWIVYSHPIGDIALTDEIILEVSGGPFEVPHAYYGLGFNLGISATFPNGTNTGDYGIESALACTGQFEGAPRGSGRSCTVNLDPDAIGVYFAMWNVTYATSNDTGVGCDLSRISFQTWIFNASFNVVDSSTNPPSSPVYTTTTTTFPTKPTGTIFESNGASSTAPNIAVLAFCVFVLISSA